MTLPPISTMDMNRSLEFMQQLFHQNYSGDANFYNAIHGSHHPPEKQLGSIKADGDYREWHCRN